ncbi:hypothetical protein T440DRAFT_469776 [Plenodomus tracheiphilus IPT5]|uniref:DUF1996 domain-containing protein n=1 Tax=Plenodomus tracheiphilus IPT5 TaxID=1408161 RepID=A0A6A7B0J1_9PLEO|nr:hypothetical protein T440DRAFT_469776 [Plenodomus tracheiphilus IPT5]
MSPSILYIAGLLAGANAYTVINAASPFMQKNIDPIVFPGSFSESHLHTFYGSDAITANTKTSAELQKGCTNMENPNDLSTYWVPTVLYTKDGGKTYEPVPLSRFSAYYNLGETPAEIAIPQDVKMVAGVATAKTQSAMDPNAKAEWFCEGGPSSPLDANGFPSKTCTTHLQQLLYFPQCVNTDTLETGYKSRDNGTPNWCPKGMKSMPQLRFSIRYDLRKVLPNGWSGEAPIKLASGPAWSSHGDFINGWTEEAAQNMVATTKDKQHFAQVDGKLGGFKSGPTCKSKDADPSHGVSTYAESVAAMAKRSVDAWGWATRSRMARV